MRMSFVPINYFYLVLELVKSAAKLWEKVSKHQNHLIYLIRSIPGDSYLWDKALKNQIALLA